MIINAPIVNIPLSSKSTIGALIIRERFGAHYIRAVIRNPKIVW